MADTTLDKAISDAATQLTKEAKESEGSSDEGTSSAETTETQEEETEETEESSETSEEDLSEEEAKESKELYKLLKNPDTRNAVLAALAAKAGILPKPGEELTKKEETAAKKEIKDILKEALGNQYDFLSEKLAKGIEAILEQERSSHEEKLLALQRTNIEREVVSNYNRLARETKGESRKLEARMAELATEIPIGSMEVRTYINRLYSIASGEKKSSSTKPTDQIRKNSTDVSQRLKSGASPLSNVSIPDKKMSIDESIKWAQEQINKGKK